MLMLIGFAVLIFLIVDRCSTASEMSSQACVKYSGNTFRLCTIIGRYGSFRGNADGCRFPGLHRGERFRYDMTSRQIGSCNVMAVPPGAAAFEVSTSKIEP